MKVCKNCGEINSNDTEYCCNCGHNNFMYQEEVRCSHCGKVNDKSFEHCIYCGQNLHAHDHDHVHKHGHNHDHAEHDDTYTAVPVNVRDEMGAVYPGVTNTETARCPHCNTAVPITAIFCTKCGTSVANLHDHRVVQRKICPHCGRHNALEAAYCSYCFCSLIDASTEDLQVVHEGQNCGELIVRQTYLEGLNGRKLICPNCSTINADNETFCVNCGLKLQIEPAKKYCPNCGTENSADSEFCTKCRWSFEGGNPDEKIKWSCPRCEQLNSDEDAYCSNCGQKRKA